MADKKSMSIEEILATARATDGGGPKSSSRPASGEPSSKAESSAAEPAPPAPSAAPPVGKNASVAEIIAAAKAGTAPKSSAPPAKPAAGVKAAGMSVAEMMAAARAEKSGAGPASQAKDSPPKAEVKKPSPASKPAPEAKASEPVASGPKDTASILAAAKKATKPGPISKSQAVSKDRVAPKPGPAAIAAPQMPEKPVYAVPRAARAAEGSDRRGFLSTFAGVIVGSSLSIGFVSLAVTNLLWVLGFARFMFPNILTEPPTKFKVGFPDDFAPGQVENKFKAQFGVWIVRDEYEGQPQIFALRTVCTHLGCTPNWLDGEQKFKCPCHGSGFYKDGINFEGPAPRPLERYALRLADDGQLEVDKSRKFNEELGQWKDPASFVTV